MTLLESDVLVRRRGLFVPPPDALDFPTVEDDFLTEDDDFLVAFLATAPRDLVALAMVVVDDDIDSEELMIVWVVQCLILGFDENLMLDGGFRGLDNPPLRYLWPDRIGLLTKIPLLPLIVQHCCLGKVAIISYDSLVLTKPVPYLHSSNSPLQTCLMAAPEKGGHS